MVYEDIEMQHRQIIGQVFRELLRIYDRHFHRTNDLHHEYLHLVVDQLLNI